MKSVLAYFGIKPPATGGDGDSIRRIAAELDRLPEDRARQIAAFAFILSRIARADHEVSAAETATIERLVREKGGLSAEQAVLVVELARTQQRLFGGTDDFLVTREFARAASYDEKLALIDCLFAVAAADARILTPEADEIARTARELRVEQADLSRIRASYRQYLAAREGLADRSSS